MPFSQVTGVKRSLLGQEAAGNPSFVSQLLAGVSPKLATVKAVRATMKSLASPAEWREICARAGAMPAILTGAPLPSPEPPARCEDRDPGPERPVGRREDQPFMDTREAAALLGLSPSTLARYRTTGEGPLYCKLGGCVRYRGNDVEAWAADRRVGGNGGVRAGGRGRAAGYRREPRASADAGLADMPDTRLWPLPHGGGWGCSASPSMTLAGRRSSLLARGHHRS